MFQIINYIKIKARLYFTIENKNQKEIKEKNKELNFAINLLFKSSKNNLSCI